jgi:hypothetical protein
MFPLLSRRAVVRYHARINVVAADCQAVYVGPLVWLYGPKHRARLQRRPVGEIQGNSEAVHCAPG